MKKAVSGFTIFAIIALILVLLLIFGALSIDIAKIPVLGPILAGILG